MALSWRLVCWMIGYRRRDGLRADRIVWLRIRCRHAGRRFRKAVRGLLGECPVSGLFVRDLGHRYRSVLALGLTISYLFNGDPRNLCGGAQYAGSAVATATSQPSRRRFLVRFMATTASRRPTRGSRCRVSDIQRVRAGTIVRIDSVRCRRSGRISRSWRGPLRDRSSQPSLRSRLCSPRESRVAWR